MDFVVEQILISIHLKNVFDIRAHVWVRDIQDFILDRILHLSSIENSLRILFTLLHWSFSRAPKIIIYIRMEISL